MTKKPEKAPRHLKLPKKFLGVNIPCWLHNQLEQRADANGRSTSKEVEFILRAAIEKQHVTTKGKKAL